MIESKRLPRSFSVAPATVVPGTTLRIATKATVQEQIVDFLRLVDRFLRPTTLQMFSHYFQGRGATRTLQSFGLARKFETHPDVRLTMLGQGAVPAGGALEGAYSLSISTIRPPPT